MNESENDELVLADSIEPQHVQWKDENGELHQGVLVVREVSDTDRVGEFWWKLMLSDLLSILDDISGKQTKALKAILAQFNPRTGIIIMSQEEIAKEAGVSKMTMNKVFQLMCKRGVIARQKRGVYCINPYFMSQGGQGRFDTLMIQYKAAVAAQEQLPMIDVVPNKPSDPSDI